LVTWQLRHYLFFIDGQREVFLPTKQQEYYFYQAGQIAMDAVVELATDLNDRRAIENCFRPQRYEGKCPVVLGGAILKRSRRPLESVAEMSVRTAQNCEEFSAAAAKQLENRKQQNRLHLTSTLKVECNGNDAKVVLYFVDDTASPNGADYDEMRAAERRQK
jgi:hypothetical protein